MFPKIDNNNFISAKCDFRMFLLAGPFWFFSFDLNSYTFFILSLVPDGHP